jgi:chemotaxis protein histidine kinase CheA
LDTLIAAFWDDADALIAAVKSEAIEPEAIQRALHTLKGTAETMGFAEIARLAAVAEGEFRRTGHRDIAAIEESIGRTRGLGGGAIKQPSGTAGSRQAA